MEEQALSHVRVLDLTHHIAGPFCTKLLAEYRAQVIKVERPGRGDPAGRMGPFCGGHAHPERSGPFLHLNSNKLGITLNLKTSTGAMAFRELIQCYSPLWRTAEVTLNLNLGPRYSKQSQATIGLYFDLPHRGGPQGVVARMVRPDERHRVRSPALSVRFL
ncbi:MAG: CoA transferase [Dehalococcoidia bacterium]